jgi:Cu/Zn superoxide dismutase
MKKKKNEDVEILNNIEKKSNSQKSHSKLQEVFLVIFVALTIVLGLTLYFYYKVNSNYQEEISFLSDVHILKAKLHPVGDGNVVIKGYIEVTEVFDGVNIIGKIEGLSSGTTHAVHILEFSDISQIESKKMVKDLLKHYNPTNVPHSCPARGNDDTYHYGDLGNVIANNEGVGYISIIKKIPIRSVNGRMIVVTNGPDKCENTHESDEPTSIIGYGLLNAFKQDIPGSHVTHSQDYFVREINSAKKMEFEKENKIKPSAKNGKNDEEKQVNEEKINNMDKFQRESMKKNVVDRIGNDKKLVNLNLNTNNNVNWFPLKDDLSQKLQKGSDLSKYRKNDKNRSNFQRGSEIQKQNQNDPFMFYDSLMKPKKTLKNENNKSITIPFDSSNDIFDEKNNDDQIVFNNKNDINTKPIKPLDNSDKYDEQQMNNLLNDLINQEKKIEGNDKAEQQQSFFIPSNKSKVKELRRSSPVSLAQIESKPLIISGLGSNTFDDQPAFFPNSLTSNSGDNLNNNKISFDKV